MRARLGKRWIVLGAAGLGLLGGALTLVVAPAGYTATGTLLAGVPRRPWPMSDSRLASCTALSG